MTITEAIEQYHLNLDNVLYLNELSEFTKTGHPFNFIRFKNQQMGFAKMSASNITTRYWQTRGYSEDEARQKISEIQGARTSKKKRLEKMLSQGISKDEAELKLEEWSKFKSKSVTDAHKRAQEKDPLYGKSMSYHCKEFWTKKGFSEEESTQKAAEVCANNRKKFREKLDTGEIEKGWNNCTVEYYLKKGMTMVEAKAAVTERQKTFTLEKCIINHGEENGRKIWEERQEKWKDSIYSGESCITVGTSIISKEFSTHFDATSEFYIRTKDKCFIFDLRKHKSLIEFNGDFWHCNPAKYTEDYFHPIKKMTAKAIWAYDEEKTRAAELRGYKVLTVWETVYKLFPEETINQCKQFLNENN